MVFGGRGSKDGFKLTWVFILVLGVCIVWFLVAGIIKVGYGWVCLSNKFGYINLWL